MFGCCVEMGINEDWVDLLQFYQIRQDGPNIWQYLPQVISEPSNENSIFFVIIQHPIWEWLTYIPYVHTSRKYNI